VESPLLSTPLLDAHRALGARLVPFAGYSMPVSYAGTIKEHTAVRTDAGLFDVSHMGELFLEGANALAAVDALVTNDLSKLAVGQAAYALCCNEAAKVLDDLIIYRLSETTVLIVCNAGNREKISGYVKQAVAGKCDFRDASDEISLIALQGPKAFEILGKVAGDAFSSLASFHIADGTVAGKAVRVARTGYTGEDGVELFAANEDITAVWNALIEAGAAPCGLGARDTLRLEAKLPLYGHELDEETTPLEAGLGRWVKLDAGDFVGKAALVAEREKGSAKTLVGFEMVGRGIGRQGHPVLVDGTPVGVVTSGGPSPTLGKNIGLAYVPKSASEVGTKLGIDVRGNVVEAVVIKTPFYKRPR
jgi:aminomethyltransferase